jgi:hypothetical protein
MATNPALLEDLKSLFRVDTIFWLISINPTT